MLLLKMSFCSFGIKGFSLVSFKKYLKIVCISAVFILVSCGGEKATDPAESSKEITIQVLAPSAFSADENTTISLTANSRVSGGNPTIVYEWLYIGDNDKAIRVKGRTIEVTLPEVDKDTLKYFQVQAYVSGYIPTSFSEGLPRDAVFVTILDTSPHPPIAAAGPDQTVNYNDNVNLSAAESSDDRGIASYHWQQISGPTISINNNHSLNANFTASEVGNISVQLTVTDAEELTHSDIIIVHVNELPETELPEPEPPELSSPPIAKTGSDSSAVSNETVTLSAHLSTDDVGIIKFQWKQISGIAVELDNANEQMASFTAPATTGTLVFSLTVSDIDEQTSEDRITIVIKEPLPIATAAAAAGIDAFYYPDQVVLLNGSDSFSKATITSYEWVQLLGSPVEITNSSSAKASFTTLSFNETLQFQLTITDTNGTTATDTVNIEIRIPSDLNVAFPTNNSFYSGKDIDVVGSYNINNKDQNTLAVEANIGGEWISSKINAEGIWRIPDVKIISSEGKANLHVRVIQNNNELTSIHYALQTSTELESLKDFVYQGSGDIAYLVESKRILKVNLSNGFRSIVSSADIGNGPLINYFSAGALDIDNNRLLVTKGNSAEVISVDLATGDRAELVSWGIGSLQGIHHDVENNRVFISDCNNDNSNVISIDLETLIKHEISSNSIGQGKELNCPSGLVYDQEKNVLYALEKWSKEIISIDINNGNRSTVSGKDIGSGINFNVLDSLILDKENNQLIVADINKPELTAVNIINGNRSTFTDESSNNSGSTGITGLGKDDHGDWYALYDISSKIRKYSPRTNTSTVVASNTSGPEIRPLNIGYSDKYNQLTILTNDGIEAVNSFTAAKVFWSEDETQNSLTSDTLPADAAHTNTRDLCFNKKSNSLIYIRNQNELLDSIINFDLTTRSSQIISDQNTGSGDLYGDISAIYCPLSNDNAYLVRRSPGALYSLDVTNGQRDKVMDMPNISGEDIELTNDGKTAYISSTGFQRALYKVDLTNYTSSILSSNDIGNGIQLSNPSELAFDEKHQRVFMMDYGAIILVDILTGDRIIFSKK